MIATVSFQVDPANEAEVEILFRAMRELEEHRGGGTTFGERFFDPVEPLVFNHPPVDPSPAPRTRPSRYESTVCSRPGCDRILGSPQGAAAHYRWHDRNDAPLPPREGPEPAPTHRISGLEDRDEEEPELDAEHAFTTSAKRRSGWVAWCRCGHTTDAEPTREDAEAALADHVEGAS